MCLVLYFSSSRVNLTNLVKSLPHAMIYFLLSGLGGGEGRNINNKMNEKLAPVIKAQMAL